MFLNPSCDFEIIMEEAALTKIQSHSSSSSSIVKRRLGSCEVEKQAELAKPMSTNDLTS